MKGTTSEKAIKLRHEIMLRRFTMEYNPPMLDENRVRAYNKTNNHQSIATGSVNLNLSL